MYKIIHNNKVIDVVKVPHFFKLLATGHVAFTDRTSAQGIKDVVLNMGYPFRLNSILLARILQRTIISLHF